MPEIKQAVTHRNNFKQKAKKLADNYFTSRTRRNGSLPPNDIIKERAMEPSPLKARPTGDETLRKYGPNLQARVLTI